MQKMMGKIARIYPLLILMGFMIVALAFVIGYFNSQSVAAYFAESKQIRETTLMAQRAAFESVDLWLPYFKFLGLGLLLGGIVMALRVIADNLKAAGNKAFAALSGSARPPMASPSWYGQLMPVVMVLGELVFAMALIVSLNLAGIARHAFANPLPVIDAAGAGSALLAQVQTIHAATSWLVPFKFFGIATEFLAIVMGLATIIHILGRQTAMLEKGILAAQSLRRKAASEEAVVA